MICCAERGKFELLSWWRCYEGKEFERERKEKIYGNLRNGGRYGENNRF